MLQAATCWVGRSLSWPEEGRNTFTLVFTVSNPLFHSCTITWQLVSLLKPCFITVNYGACWFMILLIYTQYEGVPRSQTAQQRLQDLGLQTNTRTCGPKVVPANWILHVLSTLFYPTRLLECGSRRTTCPLNK